MSTYPVHYQIDRPRALTRLQLLIRLIAFCALGVLGLSFGTVFLFGYLALPVIAAVRCSGRAGSYVSDDGPRVLAAVRWYAAVAAWAGLVSDRLPTRFASETISIEVEGTPHPTPSSAVWRVLGGIPSAVILYLLGVVGVFVWIWAALSILFVQRIGDGAFDFLVGLQRWTVRLLVYQASLVDDYPPFSFSDAPPQLDTAHATV